MKMKTFAIGITLLAMTASAMAFDGDRRSSNRNNGAIAWSTKDQSGNRLSIVFQFGDRSGVDLRYEKGRDDRYDRYDRYDRNDRDRRYDRDKRSTCPPVYDYKKYRGRDYDRRQFSSYEEWSDWRQWQSRWSKRKNWQYNDRDRARAWDAFSYERTRAYDRWERSHRDDRRQRDDDDWCSKCRSSDCDHHDD